MDASTQLSYEELVAWLENQDMGDLDAAALDKIVDSWGNLTAWQRSQVSGKIGAESPAQLDRLMARLGVNQADAAVQIVLGQRPDSEPGLKGELSIDEIITLAGGPLPLEQRQRCPKCDAVISIKERTCPWCSTKL